MAPNITTAGAPHEECSKAIEGQTSRGRFARPEGLAYARRGERPLLESGLYPMFSRFFSDTRRVRIGRMSGRRF
jgi:hypothetical protein